MDNTNCTCNYVINARGITSATTSVWQKKWLQNARTNFFQLDTSAKKRYTAKISLFGSIDPYVLNQQDFSQEISLLSPIMQHALATILQVSCMQLSIVTALPNI